MQTRPAPLALAPVALALLAAAPFAATAGAQIISDTRFVAAQVEVSRPGASDSDMPASVFGPGGGAQWGPGGNAISALASVTSGSISGGATQVSGLVPITDGFRLEGQGNASLSASVLTGTSATGLARSVLQWEFDVPAGASISYQATRVGDGGITLRTLSGTVLASGSGVFNNLSTSETRLLLEAIAEATIVAPPSGSSGGSFTISVTVVPTPATAVCLTALAPLALRRRRATR